MDVAVAFPVVDVNMAQMMNGMITLPYDPLLLR